MKFFLTTILFSCLFVLGSNAQEGSKLRLPNLGFTKLSKVPKKPPGHLAPHHEFDIVAPGKKPKKVKQTHTVELRRIAFTKWEEHCCGIMMKGNYMKVTYQTFFSDGSSVVWNKEYRS